jgi:hypothetical protein
VSGRLVTPNRLRPILVIDFSHFEVPFSVVDGAFLIKTRPRRKEVPNVDNQAPDPPS